MKVTKMIVLVAIAILSILSLMGCGGGGPEPSMQGVANIHANSMRPMAAFVYVDSNDNLVVDTATDIEPSSSGWQDKPFQLSYPKSNKTVWAIVAFNDIAIQDGEMQTSEYLGASILLLVKKSDGGFSLIRGSTQEVMYEDANTAKGNNVWIDCTYDRSTPPTTAEIVKQLKELQKKL